MTSPQDELARYFEVCGYEPDDTISVVTRAAADGPLFWSFLTVAEAPRQIAARSKVNCWFSANPMTEPDVDPETGRRGRGSTKDVYAVRALWADLDIKTGGMPDKKSATAVMHEISGLIGARPVAVVWSGHGFQPRWKIDIGELHTPERMAPVIERFGRLVQLIAQRFGGKADSVYDMPRIIRAPHTRNIKPELEPVDTKVWLYDHDECVTFERLLETLDAYVPARDDSKTVTTEPEIRHVGFERGNAYVQSALEYIQAELGRSAEWSAGQTDEKGRGWEKLQADAAFRLASLAKADWNDLSVERAKEIFIDAAPLGGGWTIRDVIKKWESQVRRADPADPPADTDDPLAGGGVPPLSSAARAAATNVWSEGDAGAGAGGDGDRPAAAVPDSEEPTTAGVVPGPETEGLTGDIFGPTGEADPDVAAAAPEEELTTEWRRFPWTEQGNAARITHRYGDVLRYLPKRKTWMVYNEGVWRENETGGEWAASELFNELYRLEGPLYSDEEYPKSRGKMTSDRAEFAEWVDNQQSASKMQGAAKVIRFHKWLDAASTDFDRHPMLLNVANGVVDLATSELGPADPALLLAHQLDVAYDPDAKAPRWEAFLEQAMPSPDMRDYLQRIAGYTLTGDTGEQAVFFHVGKSGAGKSVFLEVMAALFGELANSLPADTLLNKKQAQHPTDIADMESKRYIYLDETPEGARLDETLIKRLSGESTMRARGMGENFRSFKMVGKLWLATNHDPHISDDPAVHRRLHYIPWKYVIPAEEKDTTLKARIIAEELQGVLAWAVKGTRRWMTDRLAMPAEALTARAAYIASEDEFQIFIDEELIVGADSFTAFKDVYRRYTQWCDGLRMKPMGSKAFTQKLTARGLEYKRTNAARGFKVALQGAQWARQDPLS